MVFNQDKKEKQDFEESLLSGSKYSEWVFSFLPSSIWSFRVL